MSIKLLVVDDEDNIRNGIAKYIRMHTDRFDRVLTAADGREAMDILFMEKPDIMLLDIKMPLMDGLEVMQEANRAEILPYTIILSGFDDFQYCRQAMRYSAKDYLLKPVRSSDILEKVLAAADKLFGPEEQVKNDTADNRNSIISMAKQYIDENYYEQLRLGDVADKVGVTAGYLSSLFQKEENLGFVDYLNEVRISHACVYLTQQYLKTYEVAYKVGFRDEKYFSKVFRKITGYTPSEYRKNKVAPESL